MTSLDAATTTFEAARPVVVEADGTVDLEVPKQSVQLLRIDC